MLKKLEIYGLFGLYDYLLDFTQGANQSLKIITGPNGYGKTTVFQSVYALFSGDLNAFFHIPFSRLAFSFGEDIIQVRKRREVSPVEEESDLPGQETSFITFEQIDAKSGITILSQEFEDSETKIEVNGQLQLLLNSMKCFFLTDERLLLRKNEDKNLVHNADYDPSMLGVANKMASIIKKGEKERGVALFRDIVDFFKFADKELVLDGTFGIRFRIMNASKTLIPITALSSGEKHLLLQLFELVFDGQSGDLVLIDEPELSFHPAWLNVYVSMLEKIQDFKLEEGREMQIILATHSPLLIGGRWDETLDLYSLRNNG